MSEGNGQQPARKPPPDAGMLTPNDQRRLRVALGGKDPAEVLSSDQVEDIMQAMVLAMKLRDDPSFTWDQAGDIAVGDVFDMSGQDREPDPQTAPPGSPGPGAEPPDGTRSNKRRPAAASAPN